jgi:aerobic-type carbon monoxide dehydrogenase small subunit (CoxS/CutS family)
MEIACKINGEEKKLAFEPYEKLLHVLRREGYYGVKDGCSTGDCGSCTVLVDGKPVKSCLMFAAQAKGKEIITIEGLGSEDKPHLIQQAFSDAGAVQCGFCTPAMVLSAKALIDSNPDPSEEEVRRALDGVLCRCTGYMKILDAVKLAAKRTAEKTAREGEYE